MRRVYMMVSLRAAVILALAACSPIAAAWGVEGHQIVGLLATTLLTPAASAGVADLLASESNATLAAVSTWADETRNGGSAKQHYVNLGSDCSYVPTRDCPGRQCVVAAIEDNVAVLNDPAASKLSKNVALKNVIHFVGDIGQPLHAFGGDRGGNTYQVQAFGHGTNLHAVYDSGLIRSRGLAAAAYAHALAAIPREAREETFAPFAWAEESCAITQRDGFFPSGHVLPVGYAEEWLPVVDGQLAVSARRLAAILNVSFRP